MDDLMSEDWQKSAKPSTASTPANNNPFSTNYSGFRASPQTQQSGTVTPQISSRPPSTVNGAKGATKDTFGNLLSLKSQQGGNNTSMQERQRQLLDEKNRQKQQESQLWERLGSGRGTPEVRQPSPAAPQQQEDVDDILAAFHKDAPVDNSSHFAPPSMSNANGGRSTPATTVQRQSARSQQETFDEDDDPFGLGTMQNQRNGNSAAASTVPTDEDDILGDLGKPVTERSAPSRSPDPRAGGRSSVPPQPVGDQGPDVPGDQALAELIDMGFPADNARIALAETGGEVQNAVGWLLQQAHEESKQKLRSESAGQGRSPQPRSRSPQRQTSRDQSATPAWMRQGERNTSATRGQNNGTPTNGSERDATQVAQEYGAKFLKSANSLWKASQKQMAKTMADFQQETDSNAQPKWMRDASADARRPSGHTQPAGRAGERAQPKNTTEEAAMLDMPKEALPKATRPTTSEQTMSQSPARGRSPAEALPHRPSSQPRFTQQLRPQPDRRPATKLSRQEVDDQSAQAYVSPARRKRPTPEPQAATAPPHSAPAEVDLFSPAPPTGPPSKAAAKPAISRPTPSPRPQAPSRSIPSVSPTALSTSSTHRKAGGEHFKRGDYAAAHESYNSALNPLPAMHPVAIVVLTNRSLTALKTGDAKVAVSDADRALEIIGPSQGADETIDLGGGEGSKDMRDFYGKALMRKAEALEHMERYADAASVWRLAVEASVGGAVSLRGRDRCERAAAPKPPVQKKAPVQRTAPTPGKATHSKALGNSMQGSTLPAAADSGEAVRNLRAANAAAEKADEERFALADSVDARLAAWKNGKTDNLRALLQSLETVLWDGAGWKKVGMSDLIMVNKVKIVYMKAIGKVHPDKIPQDATTEQRMVSAAVFSTLNEAWDKFRKENNL